MSRGASLWIVLASLLTACSNTAPPSAAPQGQWISIFNGSNLDGWIPKIAGHGVGDNYANTFRVENGLLRVSYDQYDQFGTQFGGLYYKEKLSHYWLRVEYRFVGNQANGAPEWAFRDSGVMMHTQAPDTLQQAQEFPVSIELNFIGAKWTTRRRPTGNICTNSTKVLFGGAPLIEKCSNASTTTVRGDQWVTVEAEVLGNDSIKHYVNGELVAEYQQPQLDEQDPEAARLLAAGATKQLAEGYIALQSNSHPIEFRKIEILPLNIAAAP
jgi:hypothetical protein